MDKRCSSYDLLRLLACLMIVMMHSPLPGKEGDGLFLSSISYLTAPGIGLFFMVSGTLLLPVLLLSMLIPAVCKWKNIEIDFYSMFWYLSVFVAIQCVFWWKLVGSLSFRWTSKMERSVLSEVSKLTFGIYLVHIFIMRYLLWKWDFILGIHTYWVQTVTIIIFTFVGSLIITYLISLFPFAKYLIGYQRG